jgi:copper homeostasis protein
MPGSGVNLDTIDALIATLDVKEVHSSCSASTDTGHSSVAAFGFSLPVQKRTDVDLVRKMKARLSAAKS